MAYVPMPWKYILPMHNGAADLDETIVSGFPYLFDVLF